MKRHLPFIFCAVLFLSALAGSVYCGWQLTENGLSEARQAHLRNLIYFHFGITQMALLAAGLLLYYRRNRRNRYYLLVSYNERGLSLTPPGIQLPEEHVYRCHLGNLHSTALPPADRAPVLVYPLFMQSGSSSGKKLSRLLTTAYSRLGGRLPSFYFQPVLGASPWLAEAAAAYIRPLLQPDTAVLVVAHGSTLPEPPPEPSLFCRRLRDLLPQTEVALGYFGQHPEAREVLAGMGGTHILVLPFLLTEGVHTRRDLPTEEDALRCGKTLFRLPVATALLPENME